jgi:hypothetical protein
LPFDSLDAIGCDRTLGWRPRLCCSGVRADALNHGARAVRALRRKMLLQTQRTKGAQGVDGENLLWRPIREKRDRDRDQPANEVRVAVAAIVQDRFAVGARSRLAFQPYLTDAAKHLIAFIVGRLAKGLEGMTEFDDITIAILPIVEGGEIVTNGLERSQAILAYARAFWRPIASDRRVSVAPPNGGGPRRINHLRRDLVRRIGICPAFPPSP